jgi:hypothetical protein
MHRGCLEQTVAHLSSGQPNGCIAGKGEVDARVQQNFPTAAILYQNTEVCRTYLEWLGRREEGDGERAGILVDKHRPTIAECRRCRHCQHEHRSEAAESLHGFIIMPRICIGWRRIQMPAA